MTRVVVTCEHGGNTVPASYRPLFARHAAMLASHRGYDPGALALARALARALDAPLVAATVSRLLIDLNRSRGHPRLFSPMTRALPRTERERIVARFYAPYRMQVEEAVRARVDEGFRVVHLSAHTFTPVLDGRVRDVDVGLLYDPRRREERVLCERWRLLLAERVAPLRVRRNAPYRGDADGLTTALRRRWPAARYLGIEIEVNQKHVAAGGAAWHALRAAIVATAATLLA